MARYWFWSVDSKRQSHYLVELMYNKLVIRYLVKIFSKVNEPNLKLYIYYFNVDPQLIRSAQ